MLSIEREVIMNEHDKRREETTQKILALHTFETRQSMNQEDRKPCTCGDSHCESCGTR